MIETDPKQTIIDEVGRLMNELDKDSCEILLERIQNHHRVMTTPMDGNDHNFASCGIAHACDQSGRKPLCGQGHFTFGVRLVTADKFQKLFGPKCGKCEMAIKRLKGKEPLVNRPWGWWRESYNELLLAIFHANGQKAGQWCSTTELLPKTKYKNREYLRVALRHLKRRGLVEIGKKGRECRVRLTCDCVKQGRSGRFYMDFDALKEPKPESVTMTKAESGPFT